MAPFSDEYLYVEMANKVLNHRGFFITFLLSNAFLMFYHKHSFAKLQMQSKSLFLLS
jgi:hypothetical protein